MNKIFENLYKKDSKGKIRVYQLVVTKLPNNTAMILMETGLYKGKLVENTRHIKQGKNIGKSNETTPYQQALNEATSMYAKKQDEGYRNLTELGVKVTGDGYAVKSKYFSQNSLNYFEKLLDFVLPKLALDTAGRPRAMKYHKFRLKEFVKDSKEYKGSKAMKFPVIASPKLDGICAIGIAQGGLSSRGGKDAIAKGGASLNSLLSHIVQALQQLNYGFPLNGELYINGCTLQEVKDACTKLKFNTNQVEFHIFDVIDLDKDYNSRVTEHLSFIKQILADLNITCIKVVPIKLIESYEHLMEYENEILSQGYEGLIIRNFKCMYRPDYRTADALKLVRMDEMEVVVIDVVANDNDPTIGKFVCEYQTDHEYYQYGRFYVSGGKGFNRTLLKDVLTNKQNYIGKLLTIKHRGFTNHNIPRIAKGEGGAKAFRDKNDL